MLRHAAFDAAAMMPPPFRFRLLLLPAFFLFASPSTAADDTLRPPLLTLPPLIADLISMPMLFLLFAVAFTLFFSRHADVMIERFRPLIATFFAAAAITLLCFAARRYADTISLHAVAYFRRFHAAAAFIDAAAADIFAAFADALLITLLLLIEPLISFTPFFSYA